MSKVIFLISGIDFNSAPFNRFLTIVKAVSLTKHKYEVIDIRPSGTKISSDAIHVNERIINYDGVTIERILKSTKKSNNFFLKIFRPTRERFFAIRSLKKKVSSKNSVVYLISASNFDCLFYYFLSKLFKYKYVHERSEYPMLVRNPRPD